MTKQKYLVDTNGLLNDLKEIINEYRVYLCSTVIRELDKHKEFGTDDVKFKAREATRILDEHEDEITFLPDTPVNKIQLLLGESFDPSVPDNRILATAVEHNIPILTGDRNVYYSAKTVGHEAKRTNDFSDENFELDYKGFVEVEMTQKEHQDFLNRVDQNEFNLLKNQYLFVFDKDNPTECIGKYVYNGEFYVTYKTPKWKQGNQMKEFAPYDVYQQAAMNALESTQFTMLRGKAGTAKTLLALTYAFKEIENHRYDKLIIFSNDIPTKGAFYHGLVKGTLEEKLFDSTIGGIMSSKLGSEQQLEALMITEKITILPMSKLRGFDTSGMNAIVMITEAQNTSRELMKLAIQRVGEDCKLIIEGDNHTQLDSKEFVGSNNGMTIASEVFRGEDYYAEVELQHCYRSRWAERAEKMSLLK